MVSGFDSWCHDCRREYARNYTVARDNGRNYTSPYVRAAALALKERDALAYSRSVCDHVAWYVERKITEFEKTHGMEAPPHMTAILAIAKSIAAEHPVKRRGGRANSAGLFELACQRCGESFEARSPIAQYCLVCRALVVKEQQKEWRNKPDVRARRNMAKRAKRAREKERRPPLMIKCLKCGVEVEAKTRKRKYCDGCGLAVQVGKAREWAVADAEKKREANRLAKQRSRAKQSPEAREKEREYGRIYRQREYERRWGVKTKNP
jgi:hypothetical protein